MPIGPERTWPSRGALRAVAAVAVAAITFLLVAPALRWAWFVHQRAVSGQSIPTALAAWAWDDGGYVPVRTDATVGLPWAPVAHGDWNGDGTEERSLLRRGRLTVTQGATAMWTSPAAWWVDAYDTGDVTGDGKADLVLSVWKQGSYGAERPFWVPRNDTRIENHVFVLDLRGSTVTPVWQSSALPVPNCALRLVDTKADGVPRLVVTEGRYADGCASSHAVAVWSWNGFGFSNDWRSEPGIYTGFVHGPLETLPAIVVGARS